MSNRRDYNGDGVCNARDIQDRASDEYYRSQYGTTGSNGSLSDGTGSFSGCCSGSLIHGAVMAAAVISCLFFVLKGIFFLYQTICDEIWNSREQKAKEAYFDYVLTLEDTLPTVSDYILRVDLEVDYGYKDSGVQCDHIDVTIVADDSLEDLPITRMALVLYEIDFYIMENLIAAQEDTGYDEVLDHDASTYNTINIDFLTSDYRYCFSSRSSYVSHIPTTSSYRRLVAYRRSGYGYVSYQLTWGDGRVVRAQTEE